MIFERFQLNLERNVLALSRIVSCRLVVIDCHSYHKFTLYLNQGHSNNILILNAANSPVIISPHPSRKKRLIAISGAILAIYQHAAANLIAVIS